jgi:TonB family protein
MKIPILLSIFFSLFLFAKADKTKDPGFNKSCKFDIKGMVYTLVSKDDSIYTTADVDSVPVYPGGEKEFFKYISNNIVYPRHDLEARIQGRVILSMVVEKNGSISNVNVLRSVSPSLDAEAILVVSNSPNWKPGIFKSKPVRVREIIPVSFTFKLEKDVKVVPFTAIPSLPGFPGGPAKFYEYLAQNTTLTKDAAIEGMTIVSFDVEEDGSISRVRINQSVSPALDKETIRLMINSPKWNPGMENEKAIGERFTVSIDFHALLNRKN